MMPRSKVSVETTEKLIELVREHPQLYDASCAEHKDAQRLSNMWQSIAIIMGVKTMTSPFFTHVMTAMTMCYMQ